MKINDKQLLSILKLCNEKAKIGLLIEHPVPDGDDGYDTEILYGADALDYLGYDELVKEARKRKLKVGDEK